MADGRAAGVKLKPRNPKKGGSEFIRARKAVVSNASLWDTQKLLPQDAVPQKWRADADQTEQCGSFMHLHLGEKHELLPPAVSYSFQPRGVRFKCQPFFAIITTKSGNSC